jgi:hypothetical protein
MRNGASSSKNNRDNKETNMRYESFLARIGDKNLRAVAEKAFEISERFAARRAAIDNDARFNEFGKREAIVVELERDFGPAFRVARQPLRDARAELDARKTKIALPAIDPTDVVAQMQRMERRAAVAALDPAERTKLLFDSATDARIIDAVLAEPAELSGLPRDRHQELLNRRLQQLHGPEFAALNQDERALAEAEAAVKVAENDLRATFDPKGNGRQFEQLMNQAVVPWLIDRGAGSIVVVRLNPDGTAEYSEATAAEKVLGKFFKNIEEYRAQAA